MKYFIKLANAQRKQLARPRPLLFLVVVGVMCSPWVALFLGDAYLRSQQAQMDSQAALFFSETPDLSTNASAYQFDQLSARLGLEPNASYQPPVLIDKAAKQQYDAIAPILTEFIDNQSNQVSSPLAPIPSELQRYLSQYKEELAQLERHILVSPITLWATDNEDVVNPNAVSPGFVNVRAVQKLLLLLALQASQEGRPTDMVNTLEASWQLNEAIALRSDLSSEVLVSVVSVWQAGLLRHLVPFADNTLLAQWQARLVYQSHTAPILSGIRYESWLQYRATQQSWIPAITPEKNAGISQKLRATLGNRFSFQTYYKLAAVENTQTIHRALDQLATLDVCATTQFSAERILSGIHMDSWNDSSGFSPSVVAKRWKTAANRALAMELSQHVLSVKHTAQTLNTWPDTMPSLPSQVCPGESWLYARNNDGTISLELSKQLLTLGPVPLRYRSTSIASLLNKQMQKP